MLVRSLRSLCTANKTITVKVPFLGESVHNVDIVKIHKNEGDILTNTDVVCEIEGDKGLQLMHTPGEGTLTKMYVKVDDVVNVDAPLFDVLMGSVMKNNILGNIKDERLMYKLKDIQAVSKELDAFVVKYTGNMEGNGEYINEVWGLARKLMKCVQRN